ncbi:hypothetical protein [Actinocorallia herbida]|uniref:hypothetical protein n=1 Tax=Actinocorallia herbida TaxID=58109 RepID=UPI0011CD548B|nr:hypothetical protein [Actinocorallia herbida]
MAKNTPMDRDPSSERSRGAEGKMRGQNQRPQAPSGQQQQRGRDQQKGRDPQQRGRDQRSPESQDPHGEAEEHRDRDRDRDSDLM